MSACSFSPFLFLIAYYVGSLNIFPIKRKVMKRADRGVRVMGTESSFGVKEEN